jgi:hypothetical protein
LRLSSAGLTEISTSEAFRHPSTWVAVRPSRARAALALWGVVVALVAVWYLNHAVKDVPFMSSRMSEIQASIEVLNRGGPPLLGSDVPYHSGIGVNHLRPIGITDDQGIYVWLPLLGHWTGESDPAVLMKWLYVGCFTLLVLVYPLIFYELFGSIAVAVAAPLLVLWKFDYAKGMDIYWILLWSMLLGLPLVFAALRLWERRRRVAIGLLVAATLVASFSTSIRIHSGLPILVAGLAVALGAGGRWWRHETRRWVRPAVAIVLVLSYLSIGTLTLAGVRAYRNHVIHQPNFGSAYPNEHPFWHNAYIGLGYLPNRYGIAWNDSVAVDAVQREHPGTVFVSHQYETTLRHLYLRLFHHDPGFVIRNFWLKLRSIVTDALGRYLWAFILFPIALLFGRDRRAMTWFLALSVPALLAGALSPVLTIPERQYELAWLGTWGALWLVALAWLVVAAEGTLTRGPAILGRLPATGQTASARALVRDVPLGRLGAALALLVAVLAVRHLVPVAPPPNAFDTYNAQQSQLGPSSASNLRSVSRWVFTGSIPSGWQLAPGVVSQPDGGATYVRTTMLPSAPQLSGPSIRLTPGRYEIVAQGNVLVGGLQLRAVDARTGSTLGSSLYSDLQIFSSNPMVVPFHLTRSTSVRIVVASWSPFPNACAWVLQRVSVARS